MKIEIEIEENDYDWEENSYVEVTQTSKSCVGINANKEGLISLAKQFLSLAYATDSSYMIHHWPEKNADSKKDYMYGDLEEGSLDFFIFKLEKEGRKNKF